MNITLSRETQQLLKKQMKQGGYQQPEEALGDGLLSLEQQETTADFAPGELDKLLAVADAEIERGAVLDGDAALRARKRLRVSSAKKVG
jgi:hypothetical protein